MTTHRKGFRVKDEARFKEVTITHAFFEGIPSPEDDKDTCNMKVNAMLQACKDMYNLAREAESLELLRKARLMKEQLTEIFGFLQQQAQKSQSGLVTPTGMPATMDAGAWMK